MNYFDKVHRWGIIWNVGALIMLLCIPVAISVYVGAWPSGEALLAIMPKLMALYWLTAIVEVITYVQFEFPVIGDLLTFPVKGETKVLGKNYNY